ncbi:hypothetical protein SS50377_26778 [Spironucleus salmonicida]|uniref:Uncharacterized protein n=1 Tax=Spironucleus salmonicida TaxID=348837 RepID=V6LX91_9EUKA|nr:hypothetical protein SS50377_26778 [Spironucleus salmonicida]|eukprot:EST49247.1 Hypothetical protein SS50377_10467 [Spironucleus salmonicida]
MTCNCDHTKLNSSCCVTEHIHLKTKNMSKYQDTANKIFRAAPLVEQDHSTQSMKVTRRGMEVSVKPQPHELTRLDDSLKLEQTRKKSTLKKEDRPRSFEGNITQVDATYPKKYPKNNKELGPGEKKLLCPFNANAWRNRMQPEDFKAPYRNASQIKFGWNIAQGNKNDVWESQTSRTHNHVPERFPIGFGNTGISREYTNFVNGKQYEKTIYRQYGK